MDVEAEKSALVRSLHDDLGGLLVGAIMDIGWISQQAGLPDAVKEKVVRAQGLLRAAIEMKRRLIENIRPTLLDHVGLFSTLRWHMKESCDAANLTYTESYPDLEHAINPEVRIGVFRIFQEALKHVLANGRPSDLSLKVDVVNDTLHCHLTHSNSPVATDPHPSVETSLHHRAQQVGGTVEWVNTQGGSHLHLTVPLAIH